MNTCHLKRKLWEQRCSSQCLFDFNRCEYPSEYVYLSSNKCFKVLDTFIALEDRHGFETAVRNVIEHVSFDVDTKPQFFELTIRALGGLLSGHIYASDSLSAYRIPWYRGQL